ncbi:hypothetical protein [Pseudomonas lurida]|uniref:Phage tail protein n=1 Tax=Pseudomonas lurida TaxID=244566 RepID=A0ABY9FQ05_9PSED|nr:hypothetical protein [Pseudomonas lurida]WLH05380.1 hypothetical protein PSH67_21435 [Pseudomonas lurida]
MDFPKSVPSVGLVDGKFIDEDAVAGTPGSLIPSAWGNAVTQEILNVIQEAGLEPDEDDNTQLNAAIDQKIAGSSVSFASQAEAEAGESTTKAMSPLRVFQAIAKVVTQATETAFGWLKIATQAQVTTGTNDSVAVTPKKLAARLLDKADLNSPVFTGEPATNSTPPLHNNSARLANTNFVYQELLSLSLSVVGSARNLRMSVAAASANATLTADEIIVAASLGGAQVKLSSFSKTINLATVGAGGMDTGTAPVSGFVAIYAIHNTTTATSALLAVNATSVAAPSVYGGANMPAGYTASALVSVWGTNASGQLKVGYQFDRTISAVAISVLNTTAASSSFTALNVSAAIPLNATSAFGTAGLNSNAGALNMSIAADNSGVGSGLQQITASAVTNISSNFNVLTPTAQRIYYTFTATGGSAVANIFIGGYTI